MRLSVDTMRLIAEEEAMLQEYQRQCIMAQQSAGVVERRFSQKVQEEVNYSDNGMTSEEPETLMAANLYPDLSAMHTFDDNHLKGELKDYEENPTTSFRSNFNEMTSTYIEPEDKVFVARDREVHVLKKHLTDFKELYNQNYHEINELRQRNHALMQETEQLKRELGIYEKNVESLTEQNNELKEEKASLFRKLAYCKLKLNKWCGRKSSANQNYTIENGSPENISSWSKGTSLIAISNYSVREKHVTFAAIKPGCKKSKKHSKIAVGCEKLQATVY